MFTKSRYSNVSLLSLMILEVRLETDREIDFLFNFNEDMRVIVDMRNAKYGTSTAIFS